MIAPGSAIQMRLSTFLLLFLLLSAPAYAPAQSASPKANVSATPRLEELRAKGSEALFNLDYEAARQTFKEIAHLFPDDPVGPQMLAWTLWLETLNKSRLQQGAIYSSQSFNANTEAKPDLKSIQEFQDLTRQAAQLARVRLQRNPRDPQMLYELGSIEILNASFAITAEGRYLAALRDASSGVDREREVIKLDPNFHDAELTIGLYDYIVGNLPLTARLVASFVGARGSKKRGIQTLERVAKEGRWERDYARLLLMALYKREGRLVDSLVLSRELQERYPHNYLFKLETADTLIAQAAHERQENRGADADVLEKEALGTFETLLRNRSLPGNNARVLAVIHFRYGETLLLLSQPERAARQFLAATTLAGAEAELITRAHLRAAQSFDLAGKRNEALAEYRIVVTRPNTRDSLEQARRGLKEPYKRTR